MNLLDIDFDYLSNVNFACYQNHVALLRKLSLTSTDLPPEEVTNSVKHILDQQISLPYAVLGWETAKLFGYARVGTNVETAMANGINYSVEKSLAVADGERVMGK